MGTWTPSSSMNHPYPPSLAKEGAATKGRSPDLTNILAQKTPEEPSGSFDVRVLDGGCCGNTSSQQVECFVPTSHEATWNLYESNVGMGRYLDNSIKESTREKRGTVYEGSGYARPRSPANCRFLRDPTKQGRTLQLLSRIVSTTSQTGKPCLCNIWSLL
ncbi:hypothetical protein GWK47_003552 [Chionoecetes opilio]|uniref:Uncharacterized protein n=1 Tax=Chionoecetes opilio TaxID=41210 RepID=A0A8J5D2E2_CHIOP|nr:hypothetical protein GWK47_003552 [Chionoecetes opilio]